MGQTEQSALFVDPPRQAVSMASKAGLDCEPLRVPEGRLMLAQGPRLSLSVMLLCTSFGLLPSPILGLLPFKN